MEIAIQFGTNASCVTWWSNFELIQVENIQLAKFGTNVSDIGEITQVNTLGPLCLWQCFLVRHHKHEWRGSNMLVAVKVRGAIWS